MTEDELREMIRAKQDEIVKPLVDEMINLLMDAYEKGVLVGLDLVKQITKP